MIESKDGQEYLRSGSPIMLLGTGAGLLLGSLHITSYRTGLWVICAGMLLGTAQMLTARNRRKRSAISGS